MKYLPVLFIAVALSGCASSDPNLRPASPNQPVGLKTSGSKASSRLVRTTAYCHLEDGNRHNAVSGKLASGNYYSAAADWSRFPVGTIFRVVENGRTYVVDDYGSVLVGTETIDLYVPSMREMRAWGVRRVNIQIIKPGDHAQSLAILRPRAKHGYIRRMVRDLQTKVR